MGFYGSEPFETATATYLWMGVNGPGAFHVEVEGNAPNYTSGIQLVRDQHWVGGLKIDVMGWTGPRGEGTTPYKVSGTFPGEFRPKIVVSGSNGDKVIDVKEIPHEQLEGHLKSKAE